MRCSRRTASAPPTSPSREPSNPARACPRWCTPSRAIATDDRGAPARPRRRRRLGIRQRPRRRRREWSADAHPPTRLPARRRGRAPFFRRAAVVAYPSLAEGFGLNALEALACGAPLVTTTGSALDEVVGDAALDRGARRHRRARRRAAGRAANPTSPLGCARPVRLARRASRGSDPSTATSRRTAWPPRSIRERERESANLSA